MYSLLGPPFLYCMGVKAQMRGRSTYNRMESQRGLRGWHSDPEKNTL